jgi:hypothetical protein
MNKWLGSVLMICAGTGLAWADAPAPAAAPAAAAAAKAPTTADTLKQIEQDWTEASKAGPEGKKETKASLLADIKSGKDKVESGENGPMDVKVLGNVAVVQGSDTEKSTMDGKDTSGKYVWTDVFVKRNGNWVAVRSQTAKVK